MSVDIVWSGSLPSQRMERIRVSVQHYTRHTIERRGGRWACSGQRCNPKAIGVGKGKNQYVLSGRAARWGGCLPAWYIVLHPPSSPLSIQPSLTNKQLWLRMTSLETLNTFSTLSAVTKVKEGGGRHKGLIALVWMPFGKGFGSGWAMKTTENVWNNGC